jgi:hypothetical protein
LSRSQSPTPGILARLLFNGLVTPLRWQYQQTNKGSIHGVISKCRCTLKFLFQDIHQLAEGKACVDAILFSGLILTSINRLFSNAFPNSTSNGNAVNAFLQPVRRNFQAVSGFPSLQVYINYGYGDEGAASWYGAQNLPRLVALKKQYDPKNQFGPGNPVPLSM